MYKRQVESNLSATVAMILMDPAAGRLEIAPLPALNRRFETYTLEMDRRFRTEIRTERTSEAAA